MCDLVKFSKDDIAQLLNQLQERSHIQVLSKDQNADTKETTSWV